LFAMSEPLLTLFTIPKAFRGATAIQQRNAIQSWQHLGDDVEVVLIGDDAGTADAGRDLGVRHIPNVERNEHGTPLVDSVFRLGLAATASRLVCYVNADIILMSDFTGAIRTLGSAQFLMCGRRWDFDLDAPLAFPSMTWEAELRSTVRAKGKLHAATGVDYFAFSRGLFSSIPAFSIGRTMWDNWLLFHARAVGVPLIDATEAIMAVHQNHDYQHVPGGIEAAWSGPEALRNQTLAAEMLVPFTIEDATHRLSTNGMSPNFSRAHLARLPQEWAALHLRSHPRLTALIRQTARAARARQS
jgi:hypothetical protein